jgi:hypothetical protein
VAKNKAYPYLTPEDIDESLRFAADQTPVEPALSGALAHRLLV